MLHPLGDALWPLALRGAVLPSLFDRLLYAAPALARVATYGTLDPQAVEYIVAKGESHGKGGVCIDAALETTGGSTFGQRFRDPTLANLGPSPLA